MPDNVTYLYLGLSSVIGLLSLYIVLLVLQFRSAYLERHLIYQLQEQ